MRLIACIVVLIAAVTSLTRAASFSSPPAGVSLLNADSAPAIDPKKASLAEALEDYIALLEKDDINVAAARWTKGEQSANDLKKWWTNLKGAHKKFNYRDWLDKHGEGGGGAKGIGDAKAFKVGGHDFGHKHTDWEKTDDGWRIARVFMCR